MLPLEEISMSEPALKTAELRAEIASSFIVDEVLDVKEDVEIVATELVDEVRIVTWHLFQFIIGFILFIIITEYPHSKEEQNSLNNLIYVLINISISFNLFFTDNFFVILKTSITTS